MDSFREDIMRVSIIILLLAGYVAAAGFEPGRVEYLPDGTGYIDNKIIVVCDYMSPGLQTGHSPSGYASTGIESIDRLCHDLAIVRIDPFYDGRLRRPSLVREVSRMYIFTVADGTDILDAIPVLTRNPLIGVAEPCTIPELHYEPNDPYLNQQWYFAHTQTLEAWDTVRGDTTRHSVIAIVDSGVDQEHDDLGPNIWVNESEDLNGNGILDEGDLNGVDDDENGYIDDVIGWDFGDGDNDPSEDALIHGSAVAGCASEATDNGILGAGMGFSARLMALKASSSSGGWNGYQCMVYAADNGANIINCSWGLMNYSQSEQAIINAIWEEGVLIVASAGGNGNQTPIYPAAYDHVMAVTATDRSDHKAYFAGFGTWVDISAPGVDIYAIYGDDYDLVTGTSFSAAMVSGLAGLLTAWYPTLVNDEIQEIIETSSDPIDHLNPGFEGLLGAGRINSLACFRTGVEYENEKPTAFRLLPNYPNPFNSSTVLSFRLGEELPVEISIYSILGQRVAILQRGMLEAGYHTITWNADDLPSGIYFARIEANERTRCLKMLLIR
jgi:serine protease